MRTLLSFGIVAMLGLLAFGAAPASAANLTLNPGFEADCSGQPCEWILAGTSGLVSMVRMTTNPSSGAASMQLTKSKAMGDPDPIGHAQSTCVTGVLPGPYTASFWFRTDFVSYVVGLKGLFKTFTSANCTTGGSTTVTLANIPIPDESWHQVSGSGDVPAGTQSVRVELDFSSNSFQASPTVCFDDVAFGPSGTTAVAAASFEATQSARGIDLRWRTESGLQNLGFNVWRGQTRLNRTLIAAKPGPQGSSYGYLDRTARAGKAYTYRLELVALNGSRTFAGRTRLTAR